MGIIIAAVILSGVVIVPTLSGLFLRGPGNVLRVVGAVMVLPLLAVWLWVAASLIFDFTLGHGDGWTELIVFLQAFALGIVGAIIGGIGRSSAGR
ncbi:MAG: hypothetical protein MUE83_04615 [Tabrizicola sp.]|jgi:hypothetical protein|nr:hypothetical protein [Tabrizicola sp.]